MAYYAALDVGAIEEYDGELQTKLALRLLALTFVRTSELRSATWEEITSTRPNGRSRQSG